MAEIRSTIDLIMERTRGMSLSAEEKDQLRREDLAKRAKGYRLKMMDNPQVAEEILEGLATEPEHDRKDIERLIWEELVEGIQPDKEIPRSIELLQKLPQAGSRARILKELQDRFSEAKKDSAQDKQKILNREKKKLAHFGISGSAVVPKLPKDTGLDEEFVEELSVFKKRLLAAS